MICTYKEGLIHRIVTGLWQGPGCLPPNSQRLALAVGAREKYSRGIEGLPLSGRRTRRLVRSLVRRVGFDIVRYNPETSFELRRQQMLRENDVVLDVGANQGQYAEMIRSNGYRGRIVSFEPLSDAYAHLARKAVADQAWESQRVALGDRDGTTRIHISSNSRSSSLLPILERHVTSAPESAYVGTEIVPIARLDSILRGFVEPTERAFLKIDTQGSELQILRGAQHALWEVSSVEVELSLLPLYAGQGLITDVVEWLDDAGFALVALKRGHRNLATGMILQLDGLFVRPPGPSPTASWSSF